MWPLIAVLGLVLAFGAVSGSNFSPNSANAEITVGDDVDDCEEEEDCIGLWYSVGENADDFPAAMNNEQCVGWDLIQDISGDLFSESGRRTARFSTVDLADVINLSVEGDNVVWICIELTDSDDTPLELDSDDYGSFEEAWCAAETFPNWDLEDDDICDDTNGRGTDHMTIGCDDGANCHSSGGGSEDMEGGDVLVMFQCETNNAGLANVTISHGDADTDDGISEATFRIICWQEADDGEIKCAPCKVEIVPALGSTQYSLVYVKLFDEDGDAARPGADVTWMTDNCEISDDSISRDSGTARDAFFLPPDEDEDLDTFDEIVAIFTEYVKTPTPANADDIHDLIDDFFDPDWDDQNEDFTFLEEPFDVDDDFEDFDTFTAVFLNCGQGHDAKPGIATVTAIVEVIGDPDLVFEVDVTVIGPPAGPIVVTADPSGSVRCGERVQITATIKDAKGVAVSDHTLLEAVTNFGGILGGTGAVAGQQGLVTPVASTVAETFGGVATFWLLTSETHAGPYEVIISTGGGGAVAGFFGTSDGSNFDRNPNKINEGTFDFDNDPQYQPRLGGLFSTPVVTGRVAVACTIPAAVAPAPAATVRAPATGQGIVPPNTGDAGLADASGNSMMLFVIAGVAVVAIAGVAGAKLVRR